MFETTVLPVSLTGQLLRQACDGLGYDMIVLLEIICS